MDLQRTDPAAPDVDMAAIVAREIAVDAALVDWRLLDHWSTDWIEPATSWSRAVWRLAESLGPLPLDAPCRHAAERLAAAPIFICGAHRSGTTLMRDLLDGHPALATLPAEGRYFGNWEHRLGADPAGAVPVWAQEWLHRLANPSCQPPYWALGRSTDRASPYVEFARAMLAWDCVLASRNMTCKPLATFALAFATASAGRLDPLRHWVDKTPGYEFHLRSIWSAFPRAKVIHMVRKPQDIAISYKTGLARTKLSSAPMPRMLRNLARSYCAGLCAARFAPAGQYRVVHYEALTADRTGTMAGVCDFLGLDWHDCLMQQTTMDRAAAPNSSFHGMDRTAFRPASPTERLWLALARLCHRGFLDRHRNSAG